MKVALDTNVLVYAEGVGTAERHTAALEVVRRLPPEAVVLPVQVLGELFNVLVRKAGRSRAQARGAVLTWCDAFPVIETSPVALLGATDLAANHQLGIWDAVVLSAAADGACRLLLSEHMQDGLTCAGVTVTNPFAAELNPLLRALLAA